MPAEAERYFAAEDGTAPLAAEIGARLFQRDSQALRPSEMALDVLRARERTTDRLRHIIGRVFEPMIREVTLLELPRRLTWLSTTSSAPVAWSGDMGSSRQLDSCVVVWGLD